MKADREGGSPVELSIKKLDIDGFIGNQVQFSFNKFIAPCISYADSSPVIDQGDDAIADTEKVRIVYRLIIVPGEKKWRQ